jgi:hypothetical protein
VSEISTGKTVLIRERKKRGINIKTNYVHESRTKRPRYALLVTEGGRVQRLKKKNISNDTEKEGRNQKPGEADKFEK